MKFRHRGVTLLELSIVILIIGALMAVAHYATSRSFTTDKAKARLIMNHVQEIALAAELFTEDTGCTARVLDDFIDSSFFEFSLKHSSRVPEDPCRESIKYRKPWAGPYYPEDKFIECHPDSDALTEGLILKHDTDSKNSYRCGVDGDSIKTGALDLSFIHEGMTGVLLDAGSMVARSIYCTNTRSSSYFLVYLG